jgi:trehalose 6-phosphate synthase/phosphatase
MRPYVQTASGALLEEKETALVYHYRNAANQKLAKNIADALFEKLQPLAAELGLHVSHASMAVEIRLKGADKGKAALASLYGKNYDFVMCAGDSDTDEDMFTELANQAFCVKVGPGKTSAAYRVSSPEKFVEFLTNLAKSHA